MTTRPTESDAADRIARMTDGELFWFGLNTFLANRPDLRVMAMEEQAKRRMLTPQECHAMGITYGQHLVWTPTPCSGTTRYEVNGHDTPEAAWDAVARWAAGDGWTPPRWWQWWRWQDTKVPAWYAAQQPATTD